MNLTLVNIAVGIIAFMMLVALLEFAGLGSLAGHWSTDFLSLAGSLLLSETVRQGFKTVKDSRNDKGETEDN